MGSRNSCIAGGWSRQTICQRGRSLPVAEGAGEDFRGDRIQRNDAENVQSDLNGRTAALHLSGWRAFSWKKSGNCDRVEVQIGLCVKLDKGCVDYAMG
jgi:hypothetical protein